MRQTGSVACVLTHQSITTRELTKYANTHLHMYLGLHNHLSFLAATPSDSRLSFESSAFARRCSQSLAGSCDFISILCTRDEICESRNMHETTFKAICRYSSLLTRWHSRSGPGMGKLIGDCLVPLLHVPSHLKGPLSGP